MSPLSRPMMSGTGTLNHWRLPTISGQLLLVLEPFTPLLRFHNRHQDRACGLGVPVDPLGAHAERLFRMLEPNLPCRARGKADVLVDELLIPRLANTEGIHVADLHVCHHLWRRYHDGGNVLVRIDAAGSQPI